MSNQTACVTVTNAQLIVGAQTPAHRGIPSRRRPRQLGTCESEFPASITPKQPLWFFLALAAAMLLAVTQAFAINASPNAVEVTQPDGAKISLRIRGDEYFHWYEDAQGFTVVRDAVKQYVYAGLDGEGKLAPTALRVGVINPKAAGLSQRVRPSKTIIESYRTQNLQRVPQVQSGGASPQQSATPPASMVLPQGTVKNLVVLCKFADHVFGTHTRAQADFDTLFNAVGGHATIAPTGSVRDYYAEASYGVMNLQSTVVAWVTLPQNESYYADGKDGTEGVYPKNAQGMVKDALDLVDPLVDFGQFDQDNDGFIDSITIIHSGYGAETGGGAGNWIWSHRWSLWALPGGNWTSQDTNGSSAAVKVYDYHTEPALWGTSGTGIVRIGVVCHETGHFFGLPDLYDTDQSSEGIGSWCLMANSWGFDGSQLHPPHFSAWCKDFLGWVTPTVITSGTYSAPQVETNPTVYKVTSGFPSGEYLLIENRQAVGFETAMPQGGLAVWHIDSNKSNNNTEGYPGQSGWPTNNNHYKIALLQADGLYEMEHGTNRGNAGDMYRGGGTSAITSSTVPSTDRYQGGIVASSNNSITNIGPSGAAISFTLNGAGGAPIIISATTASGTPGVPFSYQIAATDAPTSFNATGLPAGLTVNTSSGLISGTPSANGVYSVTLSATNGIGTGTATLTLTIAPVLTLADALDTAGLTWTTGGASNWTPQTVTTHDGQDAAESGSLGDSQLSYIETTVTGPGTLSFWWKVSSEGNYDFLRFTSDGAEQEGIAGISGTVNWQQQSASIPAGTHTLRWQFSKDGSVSAGSDAGWVDEVLFTAGVQPPVITSVVTASGVVGQAFSYQITATNIPTSFGATGLPAGLAIDMATGLISGIPSASGSFSVNLSATNSAGTGNATLALTIGSTALTLAEALDAPALTWTVGGTAGWQPQTATTHDGQDAGRSGVISNSQESWMETVISGPGSLAFWWKVSSESGYDYLRFTVDGVEQAGIAGISGTVDWQQKLLNLDPGTHVLRWRYAKDGSVSSGSDAGWVDEVAFVPAAPGPEIVVEQPAGTGLIDGASTVNFGSVVSGLSNSRTFGIRNVGTVDLTGLAISIDGADSGAFSVTAYPVAPVTSGGSTTFTVQFAPAALGPRTAILHIPSNDADENPFDVTLSGTGINQITTFSDDFDPGYDPALWAQFGGTVEANTTGQAAGAGSTGNSLWLGGSGSRFALTQPINTTGGGGVSFLLALASGFSNTWETADPGEEVVVEYSNDGTTFVQIGGPYNNTTWQNIVVAIPAAAQTAATQFRFRQLSNSGSASDHWAIDDVQIGPDVVIAPEIVVEQPAGTGLSDGISSIVFTSPSIGSGVSKTVTIRNNGGTDLTGLAVTKDGTNSSDFAVGNPALTTLAPGASTTFDVTFTPPAIGSRTAVIHIASNDADENPFDLSLTGQVSTEQLFTSTGGITIPDSGNGTPYPSIITVAGVTGSVSALRVKLNGISHTYPDDVDIFLVAPGGQVCAIMSDAGGGTGLTNLNLVFDNAAATIIPDATAIATGTYRPENYVTGEPLPPGGTGTIGTNLLALAAGGANGDWKLFVSDDAGGDSGSISSWALVFEASGGTPAPEIAVEQPAGIGLADGSSTVNFGSVATGANTSLTFTIRNPGSADLTGLGISLDGTSPADFAVTAAPTAPVTPGGSTTFTVQFAPSTVGSRTATLHLFSNDADENPFDIALSGTGTVPGPSFLVLPALSEQSNSLNTPVRSAARTIQYVYDSSLLASLPVGSQITGMAFRLNGGEASWPPSARTWTNFDVQISTSVNNPGALSTTFSNNIGLDVVTVRTGSLTIAAGSYPGGVTPNGFGPEIAFSTPYSYSGGDLLITIRHTGNGVDEAFIDATPDVAGVQQGIYSTATDAYTATVSNAGASLPVTKLNYIASSGPEIVVEQPAGTLLSDGASTVNFGSVVTGSSGSLVFRVANPGSADLTGLGITIDGGNSGDFTVTANPTAPVASGGSTFFTVRFAPSGIGIRLASLHIASNDANENPFDINLSGSGLTQLESWRQTYFGTTSNTGDAADYADPDFDGVVNFLEFSTGGTPTLTTTMPGQAALVSGNFEFTYTRANAASTGGVTFIVEWSDTLPNTVWSTTGVTQTMLSDNDTVQQWKATLPVGGSGRRFVRLRVF